MNFLQLSKRLRQEAGLSGSGPTTVVDQTGISGQIVDWINTAYIDILSQHANWRFMLDDFSFATVASQRAYTIAETGVTDLDSWKVDDYDGFRIYLTSAGVTSEQYLEHVFWSDYRAMYLFGSNRTAEGYPGRFSVQPDNGLNFDQVPNAIYTVTGEYYKIGAEMTLDADEPIIPTQYHMIIVWRALMLYAAFDAANEKYAHGKIEYTKLLMRLELNQLPQMTFGSPLA